MRMDERKQLIGLPGAGKLPPRPPKRFEQQIEMAPTMNPPSIAKPLPVEVCVPLIAPALRCQIDAKAINLSAKLAVVGPIRSKRIVRHRLEGTQGASGNGSGSPW
jgi:hypothetical protein